jgi:putative endopeptidase
VAEFAHLKTISVQTPLGTYAGQDDRNSEKIIMQLSQSGIGLPNRDYYFDTDEHTAVVRNDYQQKHLPALFNFLGYDDAPQKTLRQKTFELEKFLADSSRKLEDLRDPYKNYNKMPVAGLTKAGPAY